MTRKLLTVLAAFVLAMTQGTPGRAIGTAATPPGSPIAGLPASPTDETKVPHYFGPYPNWANSPLTLPDVTVTIDGDGTGATATATVGANGAVTGLAITDPGSGYTYANVTFGGAGTGAAATAAVTTSGAVTSIAVDNGGGGYTKPVVTIGGGGGVGTPVSVGNPMVDRAYATDYVAPPAPVPAAASQVASATYDVTAGSATGGSFTLTVDSATTAPIAWNAAAADVDAALTAAGVASSTSGSGPWTVAFVVAPAAVSIDGASLTQGVSDAIAAVGATSDVWNVTAGSATGGSFTLTVDGATSGPIAWNATSTDIQTAIANTTVTGTGSIADPWVITFTVAPTTVTADFTGLTQAASGAGAAARATYHVTVGSATGGTFTLSVDGTPSAALDWNASALAIQNALTGATVTGSGPWTVVFATAPLSFTIDGSGLTQPPAPLVPVFVVVPTALPAGTLAAFQTWNQATGGSSPSPSAGGRFHAYLLRPTGTPNEYSVVFDSGELTVPALSGAASEIANYAVAGGPAVQAGDVLGFYGAGIPVDITAAGADRFSYPAPAAPVQGTNVTFGGAGFPDYGQARTYSFGATVQTVAAPNQATATAFGGVDAVSVVTDGQGYKFPTVDFDLPDDPNGVQAQGHAVCADPYPTCQLGTDTGFLTVIGVLVDNPGSGYSTAPGVVVRDGTQFDPINHGTDPFTEAVATTTLTVSAIVVDSYGSGYTVAPSVTITDAAGTGSGAQATASTDVGTVTGLTVDAGGSGYLKPGLEKFVDTLPGLTEANKNDLGQYLPIAEADTTTFPGADYYVIAVVQHREQMHRDLPPTLLREYVQLSTDVVPGKHVALQTDLKAGGTAPVLMPDGSQAYGVDDPHYLGPVIVAQRDRAVRIVFYNLLPTGAEGDLFLPVDSSLMGSGMGPTAPADPVDQGTVMDGVRNPVCTEYPKSDMCFKDDRATLHLHGGVTPWISDGTPHQWITPANESTPWPQGVSVANVPDMVGGAQPAGVPDCAAANDGCQTFYYTNQQSARLMFYHDHAWGITRLNVYAGEAAGYVITDPAEQKLFGPGGPYADMGEGIPLIIQDRTFVPDPAQLGQQDPTWDSARWGTKGDLWYHHVYMPAQNPGDPSGMSAYGRWMYGPWFWPPATPQHGPIANPYYDPSCNLDDPSTWTYQTDPFCEPAQIPGTPNISVGMEQFNDTPVVNGTVYPTTTVDPKTYRLRILNAANDRFWNLQWYIADPTTGTDSEVALNPAELAAAQTDPNVFPTALKSMVVNGQTVDLSGPDWIQIGTEGGFLPAPVVVDGQQVTTWITDPTRFDVGNVDKHSLLLAPAERADTIVDFSKFAGKTLILYNDAPAAFPARVPSYDYFTGGPDGLTIPGYGPNTRTIMQIKVASKTPASAFNLANLQAAFRHHADGSGVFESGQHPIIVGQAAYNSAYGKTFAAAGDCTNPNGTNKCDGFARINQQGGDLFRFDNLKGTTPQLKIPLQPKALHDEMNSAAFDEFGRMTANLGLEAVPATPALQNILLYPYVAPPTEVIDATNLPKGDLNVQAISDGKDGTQIWKITHNGVDTHPIHFHLYDVQVLNRVTWDNIIIPPDATELGWKDTVRISPLEDTIVALRPIIPTLPFEIPNSIRPLSPMMPLGANLNADQLIVDPNGNVTTIQNALVNFGWEYVYHCHILSHEEMDMMRPVLVALPPKTADGLTYSVTGSGNNTRLTLTWNDRSITETSFVVQRQDGPTAAWRTLGSVVTPLDVPNMAAGTRSFTDTTFRWNTTLYSYRVITRNTVGYTGSNGAYPVVNADSASEVVFAIRAPSGLTAVVAGTASAPTVNLSFTDNASNETGFVIERSVDGGATFTQLATLPARSSTGTVTYADAAVTLGTAYAYRVKALVGTASSVYSNVASATVDAPAAPSTVAATTSSQGSQRRVSLTWFDNSGIETSYIVQRASNATFTSGLASQTLAANSTSYTWTGLARGTAYYFRVIAANGPLQSAATNATPFPITTAP